MNDFSVIKKRELQSCNAGKEIRKIITQDKTLEIS